MNKKDWKFLLGEDLRCTTELQIVKRNLEFQNEPFLKFSQNILLIVKVPFVEAP